MEISQDYLLGGRVRFSQPLEGYRAGIDPVLLAACVPIKENETFLDVGCGVGGALLCLAMRVSGCQGVGIEREPELAGLARFNVEANGLSERIQIITGDVFSAEAPLKTHGFDHVVTNPPFVSVSSTSAKGMLKRRAHQEEDSDSLEKWLTFCLKRTKTKGRLTLIHRTDRLDHIICALKGRLGEVTLIPLWSKADRPSKRFILTGRKEVKAPLTLHPGLMVHTLDGTYTPQAEAILSHAKGFEIKTVSTS